MKKFYPSRFILVTLLFVAGAFVSEAIAQAPKITSFTPASGSVGASVTITGSAFNTTAASNIVFFGATKATVTAASATSLTVTVPNGATYAPITVLNTTTSLAAYSSTNFYPTFKPNNGFIGTKDIATKVDFLTGTNPNSIAIGDIDGDGKPDLAIAYSNSANVSVLLNTGSSGAVSFANKVDFGTGLAPYSVAIGDIDGDGKLDLVIANASSHTISVLRNTGDIGNVSFALKADFPTGTKPQSVVIGDMDGDGKPDVATANFTTNNVSVLQNTSGGGTLSFAGKVDFTTGIGTNPYYIAIGDLDGDGKPDLATANSGNDKVSVLVNMSNSGTISFAGKVDFATGVSPYSVSIGDIDGDGKADVATANFSSNSVSILRNTGTSGTVNFANKVDVTTGTNPTSVAIGDIDGDGKLDLAVANYIGSVTSILRNTGSSGSVSFANKVNFASGSNSLSVAIGDLDGDGKSDLAIANNGANNVSILRNKPVYPPTITSFSPTNGTVGASVVITGTGFDSTPAHNTVFFGATIGSVTAATETSLTVTVPLGATHSVISVRSAAKNLVAYSQKQFIPTFTPNKDSFTPADFAAKVDFTTQTKPGYIAFGDLDGDGKVDMAVTNETDNTVSLFINTGTSGNPAYAARIDLTTGTQPEGVAIGDIDGDGKPDIAVTNFNSNSVSIYRNTSTIGSLNFAVKVDLALGSCPFFVVIRDINGDGRADLVTANKDANTISVVLNIGSVNTISFDAAINLSTGAGSKPYAVTVGDLDGDGKPDIAAAGYGTNMVSVFRNIGVIGSASFAAQQDFPVTTPYSISMGDLDGDGLLDLATANLGEKTVSVFKNTSTVGAINFAPKTDYNTVSTAYSVAIGDLNGDGKPDLAATNYTSNTVSLFANQSTTSTISFAAPQDIATGTGPAYVAIGDMDGDGKSDLVVANYTANSVSVLRNKLIAITTSGTLATLSTTYNAGPSAATTSFTVTASNLLTGITITPPTGFELSQLAGGASGYAGNGTAITVGAAGTVAEITIYMRLAAGNAAGSYSGNVVCTSTSANTVNVATVSSTVTGAPLTITANNVSRTYGTILTDGAGATSFTSTGLLNGDVIGSVSLAYTAGVGNGNTAADAVGNYTAKVTPSLAAGGTFIASNYAITYVAGNINVSAAPLSITASPRTKTYGDVVTFAGTEFTTVGLINADAATGVTLTSTGSAATASVATYPIVASAATGTGLSNYTISYVDGAMTVGQKTLTITASARSKTYGDLVSFAGTEFTSVGLINGNTITGVTLISTGTTTNAAVAGSPYSIVASAAIGTGLSNYNITYVGGSLTVNNASQTISFNPLPAMTYGDTNFSLSATGGASGNTITYISSNPAVATISGSTVTIVGAGTTTITSSQPGNANYNATADVSQTLIIGKASQTISFATLANKTYGDGAFNLSATGGASGNTITYISSNPAVATISGNTVTIVGAGTTTITSSQPGNANYNATADVSQTLIIGKASQTISFATLANKTYGDGAFNLSATGGASGNAVTYISSNPAVATISGNKVTILGTGTTNITASQVGNANYNSAVNVLQTLTVGKKPLTITANNLTRLQGVANPTFTVTYNGFVNGDNSANALSTQPMLSTTATISSEQGNYPITAAGAVAANGNYAIAYVLGTLSVTPGFPTSVSLAASTLFENRPAGAVAGTLSAISDNPAATFTYSLVSGTGDANNALFSISGNTINTSQSFDFETKASFSILVKASSDNGLSLTKQFTISITNVNEAPTLNAITNQAICYTPVAQTIALSGISAGPDAGQTVVLSVVSSNPSLFSELSVTGSSLKYIPAADVSGTATLTVTVKDNGGTANGGIDTYSRSFTVTLNALPMISISSDLGSSVSKGATAILTASGGASYSWSTAAGILSGQNTAILTVRPSVTTTYTVNVANGTGCSELKSILITVQDDFVAVQGINILSPNGDGINDALIIKNLDMYPNHTIKIFDRTGRILFQTNNYQNDWKGTFQGSALTDGTYFYIVEFAADKKVIKGFVSIVN